MGPRRLHTRIYFNMLLVLAVVGAASGGLMSSFHRGGPPPDPLRRVLFLGLVLVVVAVATLPLARRISRPISRLTEANRRFGRGELTYRIDLYRGHYRHRRGPRRDELGELLRSWNEMAERIEGLVRGQKELLANVSHELRSPLARVRVALALLPPDVPGLDQRVRDIEADLAELERLIDDILTTSQLETTGLPRHLERVAVRPLLQALAERAALSSPADVPAVRVAEGAELALWADGALLKRALWNLVENALKYGAPPIVLSAATEGEAVVFSVSDEGPGIAAAERQRVLQPFYRGDKARTPGKPGAQGFGLGLTLARRVAEVHGGSIAVAAARSEGGREIGCRVTLRIPQGEEGGGA